MLLIFLFSYTKNKKNVVYSRLFTHWIMKKEENNRPTNISRKYLKLYHIFT